MSLRGWAWLALCAAGMAVAAPRVSVVALFNGKAMVEIDGQRHLLRAGQTSPEGVRLISAEPRQAVVEIDGKRHALALSRTVGGNYAPVSRSEVRISPNPGGMYTTAGSINGMPVNFLVDTGASAVAMGIADARRAGIDYHLKGTRTVVSTAAGPATAYRVMLDRVSVGEITVHQVPALVLESGSPSMPLLGMSFLGRLKMRNEGTVMVLEQ